MSRYCRFLYAWGFTRWEADAENVVPELRTVADRVEDGLERPFGAAPDLGCGRGRWSLGLGERGWDVTGIDVIRKVVLDAWRRAEDAGVGTQYPFVLDIECDPSP